MPVLVHGVTSTIDKDIVYFVIRILYAHLIMFVYTS